MELNCAGPFLWGSFPAHTCVVFDCRWESLEAEGWPYAWSMPFKWGTWASLDFSIHRGSWNQSPQVLRDNLSFGGVRNYMQIFDCVGIGVPNVHVVHRSIVYLFVCVCVRARAREWSQLINMRFSKLILAPFPFPYVRKLWMSELISLSSLLSKEG